MQIPKIIVKHLALYFKSKFIISNDGSAGGSANGCLHTCTRLVQCLKRLCREEIGDTHICC